MPIERQDNDRLLLLLGIQFVIDRRIQDVPYSKLGRLPSFLHHQTSRLHLKLFVESPPCSIRYIHLLASLLYQAFPSVHGGGGGSPLCPVEVECTCFATLFVSPFSCGMKTSAISLLSMLDGNDKESFHNIGLLLDIAKQARKQLVFWIGAGASAWCGYPLWGEIADLFHSRFLRHEIKYEKSLGIELIASQAYPTLFQLCRDTNASCYFSMLLEAFRPKPLLPVYDRFIRTLDSVSPLQVLTTNVDETLENCLSGLQTIQRSDLPRCMDLFDERTGFVAKLHGSISSVQSVVFTDSDYEALVSNDRYRQVLTYLFSQAVVVFIGYGLGDHYVLDLLAKSEELKGIFGEGPHFIVTTGFVYPSPIPSLRPIKYLPEPHRDHRAAIQVIEEIRAISKSDIEESGKKNSKRTC